MTLRPTRKVNAKEGCQTSRAYGAAARVVRRAGGGAGAGGQGAAAAVRRAGVRRVEERVGRVVLQLARHLEPLGRAALPRPRAHGLRLGGRRGALDRLL